jgi:hypothetical protein
LGDGLKQILNLQSAIVFCGEGNRKKFIKELKKPYPDIVKMVAYDFDKVLPKIGELMNEAAKA